MDIISVRDLSREKIEDILEKSRIVDDQLTNDKVPQTMNGKILATLFFEPSTRTRLSFTSAMHRLGGEVLGFGASESTSIAKGENLTDTIKTVEKYCDIITIRHSKEGAARYTSRISDIPVINAGDGSNQHPTQTLLDLYTIKKLRGKIGGLNVTLLGDLLHARVIRSLAFALALFKCHITLASPQGLEMGEQYIEEMRDEFGVEIIETSDIKEGVRDADVLYVCRIQKERFDDLYEAERIQRAFRITLDTLSDAKEDLVILHALPKVSEIASEIDDSKYAKYFEQVSYGIPVRMALLNMVLQ